MAATSLQPHWETAPLSELIHFIVSHYHEKLRQELPVLIELAREVERNDHDDPTCPRGLGAHLERMYPTVLDHLAKEERVLFPMILEGYGARAGGPVRVMENEHDEHCTSLARIRELTHGLQLPEGRSSTWRELCARLASFESELLAHIHLENDVLFPRALRED
jgi:regulator of cell morphogenesis and NO signaling